MGPRSSTPTRFRRSWKHPLFGKCSGSEWSLKGCKTFETVDDLLRTIIGYVHGTNHYLLPHEFSGPSGESYYGFRDPIGNRRWAISYWKIIHQHRIDPSNWCESDCLPAESSFDFVVIAMCTLAGRRRLAELARGKLLDQLLAMRTVMGS